MADVEVAEVIWEADDGQARVVRYADGTTRAEGWASAPSGERRRHVEILARQAPRAQRAEVVPMQSGTLTVPATVERPRSPKEIADAYEAARLRALVNFGKPAPGAAPPWQRQATEPPPPDPHLEALRSEWTALEEHRFVVRDQQPPKPAAPHPKAGSFDDPATQEYVAREAGEHLEEAQRAWARQNGYPG